MSKSDISYSFLFEFNNTLYCAGNIIIKSSTGDVLYVPSEKTYLSEDRYIFSTIDHIAWHSTGRVHIKFKEKENKYSIIEESEERKSMNEVNRQKLFSHSISDILSLPKYNKKLKNLDVVVNVDKNEPVTIVCNLFDGNYYIKNRNYFNVSPIKHKLLKSIMRSISNGKINRSKALQFIIYHLDIIDNRFNSCIRISYDELI